MKKTFLPTSTVMLIALAFTPLVHANYYSRDRVTNVSLSPTRRTQGNCVQCGMRFDCRTCTGGGSSLNCNTPDCSTCWEGGVCETHGEGGPLDIKARPDGNPDPSQPESETPMRISRSTIKEIAAVHPRFGATLANLNVFGFYSGAQRVYWTPVKIMSEDIDAFLSRQDNPEYFKQLNSHARKLNRLIQEGKTSEIVYDVSVTAPDLNPRTITLQVRRPAISVPSGLSMDPSYSSLEVKVFYKEGTSKRLAEEAPIRTTWRVE